MPGIPMLSPEERLSLVKRLEDDYAERARLARRRGTGTLERINARCEGIFLINLLTLYEQDAECGDPLDEHS